MVSAGDTNYGMNNDSSSSSSSSSSDDSSSGGTYGDKDDPQHYDGGEYDGSTSGTVNTGQSVPDMPPPVASDDSDNGGDVSVDTMALKRFADNLDTIADAVGGARTRVDHLAPILPGKFKEAETLQAKISGGPQGGGGLQQGLVDSMHGLRQALMETAEKIRAMANKYDTLEELNNKAGSELTDLMQTAQRDLQAFQQDTTSLGQSAGTDVPVSSSTSSTTTQDA
ncbi:hypothetical protein ACFV3R_00475 [Streptomyces sp. NPDC059740]|uniref:hypothetical protein n=1 Tax=Streptomyces sp. NPDC059740 TaxID=3346926 RepID=UPI0036640211